jgi:hypothetical protein
MNNINVIKTDATEELFDSSGHRVGPLTSYQEKYDEIMEKKYIGSDPDECKTTSIEDVMNEFGAFEGMTETERAKFRYIIEKNIDMEMAANSNEVSFENMQGSTGYFYDDVDNEAIFPEGYNQIPNCLAGGLDIRHATVIAVNYTKQPIVISTNKGDFKTKYVVSTLPIGVLRNNIVEFFPPLDADKKKAINNLVMATMDKVYLIFNDTKVPFWSTDKDWIGRISYDVEEDGTHGTAWKSFLNLHKYTGKPILLAFNTADSAIKLEKKDDDTIKKEITKVLREMYKDPTIQEPEIVRTKWAEEPLSGGSYPFIAKGGSLSDIYELAKSIDDKLFFAGDATSPYYYGSVHAAYITGYRSAQEILKIEDNVDSPHEQLEHGIGRDDIICPNGFTLISFEESPEPECMLNK